MVGWVAMLKGKSDSFFYRYRCAEKSARKRYALVGFWLLYILGGVYFIPKVGNVRGKSVFMRK